MKYTLKKTNIAQFPQYIVLDNFWCMVKIVKTMSLKKKNTRTNLNNQHILYKIDYHGINPGFSLSLITTQFLDINKKTTKCTIFEINWFIKMSESFSQQPPKVQNIKVVHHLHTLTYMYINTSNAVIFHSSHYFKT